jgi:hypothetical protein
MVLAPPGPPPMQLELSISFSPFGWAGLQERAGADAFDPAQIVEQACAYYVSELDSGRTATRVPRSEPDDSGRTPRRFQLELEHECAERLNREAQRQAVSLERLVRHATLMYLADLDAGRVAARVAQAAGHGD